MNVPPNVLPLVVVQFIWSVVRQQRLPAAAIGVPQEPAGAVLWPRRLALVLLALLGLASALAAIAIIWGAGQLGEQRGDGTFPSATVA